MENGILGGLLGGLLVGAMPGIQRKGSHVSVGVSNTARALSSTSDGEYYFLS